MKFSEVDANGWPELKNYYDTCLIPISGLTGEETPWEATNRVARTGEWLSPIEQNFNGRTVTMPAFHYCTWGSEDILRLERLIAQLRNNGFRYVILVCGTKESFSEAGIIGADLLIKPTVDNEHPDTQLLRQQIADLWKQPSVLS
jgi:23S rRNA (pseudouridine1915-N3)-methyltransferase